VSPPITGDEGERKRPSKKKKKAKRRRDTDQKSDNSDGEESVHQPPKDSAGPVVTKMPRRPLHSIRVPTKSVNRGNVTAKRPTRTCSIVSYIEEKSESSDSSNDSSDDSCDSADNSDDGVDSLLRFHDFGVGDHVFGYWMGEWWSARVVGVCGSNETLTLQFSGEQHKHLGVSEHLCTDTHTVSGYKPRCVSWC